MKSIQQLRSIEKSLVKRQAELLEGVSARKIGSRMFTTSERAEYRRNSAELSTARQAIKLLERCDRDDFIAGQAKQLNEKINTRLAAWNKRLADIKALYEEQDKVPTKKFIAKERKDFMADVKLPALQRQLKFATYILQDI